MSTRISIFAFICLMSLVLISCKTKTTETNADIENAIADGRKAAKILINEEYLDSLQLQSYILEAKATQSKYLINNQPKSAEAFDSAFFSLLRTVKPELAKQIGL